MKVKVVKSAEYTYQKVMWKAKIEYKMTMKANSVFTFQTIKSLGIWVKKFLMMI